MKVFRCSIRSHERTIPVREDQSILEAALAAGLNLPHSCKSGHCASCRAQLIDGRIVYPRGRPPALTAREEAEGAVLLCQARPSADCTIEARQIGQSRLAPPIPDEIRALPCRIDALERLAPDVICCVLRLPASEPFEFLAGQYVDVMLEDGRRRSFSIASPPHVKGRIELHVRRAPGTGFTAAVFERFRVRQMLRIEGPIGQFVYPPGDSTLLCIAGGTGLAPIKSQIRHALEHEHTQRPIELFWGVARPIDAYDREWIDAIGARHANLRCTYVFSASDAEALNPDQRLGWVHEVAARECARLLDCEICVAGPPQLVESVRQGYPALGVDPQRIRFDSFDYAPA